MNRYICEYVTIEKRRNKRDKREKKHINESGPLKSFNQWPVLAIHTLSFSTNGKLIKDY